MAAQHEHSHYPASPHSHRARRVPAPLVLLLVALAAILVPAALGTVAALGAPAFGAQNRAGASNPATHIHTQGQSVRNPRSRRDPNTPDSRIATGYFVGDEEAAALDLGENAATDAAEEAEPGPSWTWKTREKPGADDGISEYGKERVGEETISTAHRVNVEGDVVHQHQTYIGKYGGERQFPNEWVQYPDVGSP